MTVRQLKRMMDLDELKSWQLFEERFGPLHPGIRLEHGLARVVRPFLDNPPADAFIPWPKVEEEVSPASLSEAFGMLKVIKKSGDGKAKKGKTTKKDRATKAKSKRRK